MSILGQSALIGYAVFYTKEDHLHIENIAVVPQHAGKGIGK